MTMRAAGIATLLLSIASAAWAATPPGMAKAIDDYTRPLIARGDLSGQLLIARRGEIVLERNFGMANAELRVPITADTRFNIASVTKPMTSTLTIQLIIENKLALRDSIARWFTGFPSGDSITISHLLRHRSGIVHEVIPDSEMTRPYTAAEVVERAKRLPLDFRPGSQERYSSGGYEVLARVLELVSGTSYGELLAERIFKPLGMEHSSHADSHELLKSRAFAYVPGPRGLENAPLEDFSALVGAGSVWSTARDLHRFVQGIVTGTLGPGPQQSFVRRGRLDFNGRTGGFKAWAMWDSTTGLEAVFLSNAATGAPDALKRDILKLAAGEAVPPPSLPTLRANALSTDELLHWEGTFELEGGTRLRLHAEQGTLYCNDWIMLPATDGSMFSPRDYGAVRAVTGPDGAITRLDWLQGGSVYPAPRVAAAPR